MGDIMQTITAGQLADKLGVSRQTMEKRVQRTFPGESVGLSSPLSAEQVRKLSEGKRKSVTDKTKRSPTPAAKTQTEPPGQKTERSPRYMVIAPLSITALSICLTITGLYVFANWAGGILGGMFALFLFTTVMVARERMKGATSEQALTTVFWLEIGAAGLHTFTFWRLLPEFPETYFPARVAACVILAIGAAYLSYSAVLAVRNYNAEVE